MLHVLLCDKAIHNFTGSILNNGIVNINDINEGTKTGKNSYYSENIAIYFILFLTSLKICYALNKHIN